MTPDDNLTPGQRAWNKAQDEHFRGSSAPNLPHLQPQALVSLVNQNPKSHMNTDKTFNILILIVSILVLAAVCVCAYEMNEVRQNQLIHLRNQGVMMHNQQELLKR